jgi:hypothetical protein
MHIRLGTALHYTELLLTHREASVFRVYQHRAPDDSGPQELSGLVHTSHSGLPHPGQVQLTLSGLWESTLLL